MRAPLLQVVKVRDAKGRVKRPVRFRWRLVVNGQVVAGDQGQGYNKRHRAREMGERVLSGYYANYLLDEPADD